MRTHNLWTKQGPKMREHDEDPLTVWDIAFRPDGTQVVFGLGPRVFVLDVVSGEILYKPRAHRGTVYTVDYSRDGKRFASGGSDKTIIIWTSEAHGILKYTHGDSIQKLVYNPVTQQLASCTSSDFGLWSPEQKAVTKFKVASRILCAAWTNDGQYLALGLMSGHVSIRDKAGAEKVQIERGGPVWCLAWAPSNRRDPVDMLAVGCWDQTLSFYQLSGIQVGKERALGFDPCSLSYFDSGEYIVLGGSDRQATLWTKDGVKLSEISSEKDWVWAAKQQPKSNRVMLGTTSGLLRLTELEFETIHSLYQDRYAYRDHMTDIIVQNLITDSKVRIRCKDYVTKIAIYKDRLAVQLPNRIHVYEASHDELLDMHYRLRKRIQSNVRCSLLVVVAEHFTLCHDDKLQLYDFNGRKCHEWVLDSPVRYIKVVGGPPGGEGLLVGLKDGSVLQVFINNPFPIPLIKHSHSIRCLDLSPSRNKLGLADDRSRCYVYDLTTKELLFKEPNVRSLAWNSEMDSMLCFSGKNLLGIKTGDFPVHHDRLRGFVVGFTGSKIFYLDSVSMQTIDVPQSASLYRYVERGQFEEAYAVACLGVTESDWRMLAMRAMQAMSLDVARKAFIRVRDMRYIELLNNIEQGLRLGTGKPQLYEAEILAYQGRFSEAAKKFVAAGDKRRAVDMYLDLKRWDDATAILGGDSGDEVADLLLAQARWCEETADYKLAAELYARCGDKAKAITLYGKGGWMDELMEAARGLSKLETKALEAAATFARDNGYTKYAKELYLKLGDVQLLMQLYVEQHKWEQAFELADEHEGKFSKDVFLPYAEWLRASDRYEEAQVAFTKAGRPEEAVRMLRQLAHNAVVEQRFADAAYFFHQLALEHLRPVKAHADELSRDEKAAVQKYHDFVAKADIYYAYDYLFRSVEEPFTSLVPDTLFNIARYVINSIGRETPYSISRVFTLFVLAKQARTLEAYKLARYAFERLQTFKLSPAWLDQVDLYTMTLQAKPFSNRDDLQVYCYRCSSSNPLLNNSGTGDACANCGAPFVRSFLSFEQLPLVEFVPEEGISDDTAVELIEQQPPPELRRRRKPGMHASGADHWSESGIGGKSETLTFGGGGDDGDGELDEDLFSSLLAHSGLDSDFSPVVCDRRLLMSMLKEEVVIVKWESPALRTRFFHNMLPEMDIAVCPTCKHMFIEEEYELAFLEKGHCPLCRSSAPAIPVEADDPAAVAAASS
eukprot:PLAT4607.1.p1 GENE.PLAT4607.1~~PLAT4607.1.p1  ORF type:complete len:1226 (-),score=654.52 PLAT4607.1:178-3855(-)